MGLRCSMFIVHTCNDKKARRDKKNTQKYLKFNCDKKNFLNWQQSYRVSPLILHAIRGWKICQQIRNRMELMRVELQKKIGLEFRRFHANQVSSSIQHCCKKRWWNGEFFTCQPALKMEQTRKFMHESLNFSLYSFISVISTIYFCSWENFTIRKTNQFR